MKCKPWTERLAKKGLPRQVSRGAWKMPINRELEAKRAHKPWIWEGRLPWSANRELGTFSLQNSSVSVHNVHFMVCAPLMVQFLGGRFGFFFFCSGRGKGESAALGGGGRDRIFIENPRRGGGLQHRRGRWGREGVCGELGNFGVGGLNIFFGAEMSTKKSESEIKYPDFHS